MTKHDSGAVGPRTRFAALGLAAVLANSCGAQPQVQCTASRSTFAARYTLVRGTGPCAEVLGDLLGVQTFVPDPRERGDGLSTVAIKSGLVGSKEHMGLQVRPQIVDPNPDHRTHALGKFTSVHPDFNGICQIQEMSTAALDRAPVPTSRMTDPAISVRHTWRNVRFLVTPAHTGVAFEADLTYVRDGCEAEYKVAAISPAADCNNGTVQPDQTLCSPEADPDRRFSGSGIAPEFATECLRDPSPPEPQWVACFPSKPFPSFK